PLLAHSALAFAQGRTAARALVAVAYAEAAVVGIGRALFRDPFDVVNCWDNCSVNSFLIHSEPGLAPVLAAAAAVLGFSAVHAVELLRTPLEDPRVAGFEAVSLGRSAAAVALAAAFLWTLARSRATRRAVERLAVELAELPRPGALQEALARAAGDPSIRIAYPLHEPGRYVDGNGRPVEPPFASPRRALTPILRNGRTVALLEHDPAVLDERFQNEIGAAARLAVENERLQAQALARVAELRDSRTRIVEAGDAVRRRLERDLHDGAQQRLVALSFALRLARAKLGSDPDPRATGPLDEAERALADALAAVRAVANGLFPATLASSGLATAVEE